MHDAAPPPPAAQRFDAAALAAFAQALLERAGLSADKAAAVADVLVDADLLGHSTHGLQLLPAYLNEIAHGRLTCEGEPVVLADFGAVLTWDGRRLPGGWLMLKAIDEAAARARRFGLGVVSVRRSHHIGALATYARRVAEQGLVLLLMSSAPAGSSVAPFGGTRGLLSPSPVGVGIPTGGDPVLVDVSTSITTNTMTGLLAQRGERLPGPWLLDEAGVPTDDPAVTVAPRTGTLLPLGGTDAGHKGYALGLMVEALTAGLAGHGRGDDVARFGGTLFVQVLDPSAFAGASAFTAQMDWLVGQCHANPPVDAARPVRLPGERALALRREQLAQGVRLAPPLVDALRAAASARGVDLPSASS